MNMPMHTEQEAARVPTDTFSARLVLIRHELGLSIEEIASMCDIAPATWSTWERGTKPRDQETVVKQIAAATNYKRDWLMWGGAETFPLWREWTVIDGEGPDPDPMRPRLPFRNLTIVPE